MKSDLIHKCHANATTMCVQSCGIRHKVVSCTAVQETALPTQRRLHCSPHACVKHTCCVTN